MKNKYLSARVSRVSRLCPIFRAQPGAYPPETQKPDAAPTCGRTRNSAEVQRSGFGRKRKCGGMDETYRLRQMREIAENGQNRGILDAAARKQDKAAGSCAPPQRSQLPAVRAVSGIYEGVPKDAKISHGVLQNEKSPPFQGIQRGSNERHEVNTEKW